MKRNLMEKNPPIIKENCLFVYLTFNLNMTTTCNDACYSLACQKYQPLIVYKVMCTMYDVSPIYIGHVMYYIFHNPH